MDEKEIKRTTDPRKKTEWAKSASNLQNQRRQESSGRTETEGGARGQVSRENAETLSGKAAVEDRERRRARNAGSSAGKSKVRKRPAVSEDGQERPKKRRPVSEDGQERPKKRRPVSEDGQERPKKRRPVSEDGQERPKKRRPVSEDGQERPKKRPQKAEKVSKNQKKQAARPAARKAQTKRKRKRRVGLMILLLIILGIAAIAGAFLWKKYSPSKERMDVKKYYGIENDSQMAITVDDQIVEPHGMISDGKAYVQYEVVRDYINSRFYWDANENKLLYTLPTDIVTVEIGSKDYSVSKEKKSEDYVILKTEGNTTYVALDFIQQYTNIDYEVYDSPNRVMITCDWGKKQVATVKSDTQVRYRGGVKSPIVTDVKKKDEVIVLENEQNWKKILTKDGYIGYVKKNALKNEKTKNVTRDFTEPEYTSIKKDYTINMAWHNVTNSTANSGLQQRLADSKGLTTIVPTWFHVKDTEGNLESIASTDYVNYAHQAGLEVWAAIRDFDGGIGSNDESLQLLSYSSRRENLINQLIGAVMQVGIDGINVDFEKISKDCGVHYIQFIRELSVKCRQNGIVLSVDNYVPKGYNQQYNRKEQGVMADYVIIMGYDEHNGSSLEAGSVSSYEFVKEGIEETIKEVPAEKVINGIPFFTRLWSETPKTKEELNQEAGTEAADYPMKVTSEALGMSTARDKISQAGAETTLDETTGNNYATWEADGVTYEIWLEDATSIEPKLQLMKENKLAGTAAWALGQESSDIWDLILKYVN